MAKVRNPRIRRKRHHSERFRGPNLLVERWSTAKAGHIGFHLGTGKPSTEVSRIMADGTSPESIRSIAKKWRLPMERKSGYATAMIYLKPNALKRAVDQAQKRGLSTEEYLRRIVETVIDEHLYDAVCDKRYQSKL